MEKYTDYQKSRVVTYVCTEISGQSAAGYSSGQSIAIKSCRKTLPRGFGIDWAGISKGQQTRLYLYS
jgi:HAE1 family hydrophobic/amphiphilic exporter-1